MKNKSIWILSVGHLITDVNQGALPAMLPFFISAYDLSYTAAASIVFAANLASSIIQPIFGYAADRFSRPFLLIIGLILAGVGLGLTGLCKNYQLIMALAVTSGIGIAAYHPEAARLVNFEAGNQKNTAMSIFGVGGTIGFAIGPFLITTALIQWDLKGTIILILPVSIMAMLMTTQYPKFKSIVRKNNFKNYSSSEQELKEDWWAFIRLTAVIIGRSIIFYGLNTFIPIYWISYLHQSKMMGSLALTAFAASGILGNLIGGTLADKYGPKKVLLFGFLGLAVLLPIFCLVNTAFVSLLLMIPIGLILYASYSPSIVLGQNYLPNRVGLSSGITLGVAISIGGAATPIIGKIADIYGIWSGIITVACLPILIFLVAIGLPDHHSDNEEQKRTSKNWGYPSRDRDILILKLMSKR
ncbi:MAG: MFS transporter [Desulfobacterales bacterium]|jgi:FSR family fosmidomycin resistance protein-like MFS transporter